jgi:hypothetical protein
MEKLRIIFSSMPAQSLLDRIATAGHARVVIHIPGYQQRGRCRDKISTYERRRPTLEPLSKRLIMARSAIALRGLCIR